MRNRPDQRSMEEKTSNAELKQLETKLNQVKSSAKLHMPRYGLEKNESGTMALTQGSTKQEAPGSANKMKLMMEVEMSYNDVPSESISKEVEDI